LIVLTDPSNSGVSNSMMIIVAFPGSLSIDPAMTGGRGLMMPSTSMVKTAASCVRTKDLRRYKKR
jgi:hypothetical protein